MQLAPHVSRQRITGARAESDRVADELDDPSLVQPHREVVHVGIAPREGVERVLEVRRA